MKTTKFNGSLNIGPVAEKFKGNGMGMVMYESKWIHR